MKLTIPCRMTMTLSKSPKIETRSLVAYCHAVDDSLVVTGDLAGSITGIALDSRKVVSGGVFVALKGLHSDGRDFIQDALEAGAAVIVTDRRPIKFEKQVVTIQSEEPEKLCARLAAWLFGEQPCHQVLITGTNGKTSCAEYIRQLLTILNIPAASVGTLGVQGSQKVASCGGMTSPNAVELADILAKLHGEGIDHVSIEASSHGIVQYRLDGTAPKVAVFSGLGRDHLDYHGDIEAYLAAKMRLFSELLMQGGIALYALGHEGSDAVQRECQKRGLQHKSYGIETGDIRACNLKRSADGLSFEIHDGALSHKVKLPLIGDFQCLNVLAAYGAVTASGVAREQAMHALEKLHSVAGRMQKIGVTAQGAQVFVDYAHTPDALAAVLADTRKHLSGRLWLGFGCGGDRDTGKRAVMGRVSEAADKIVVCDDNPRSENAAHIRQQILAGMVDDRAKEIGDRSEAIAFLCARAGAGDIVLIAGKGHEQGQVVGMAIYPFDDAAEARKYCIDGGNNGVA